MDTVIFLLATAAYLVGAVISARWTYKHGLPGDVYFAHDPILAWAVGLTWPALFIAIGTILAAERVVTWRNQPEEES